MRCRQSDPAVKSLPSSLMMLPMMLLLMPHFQENLIRGSPTICSFNCLPSLSCPSFCCKVSLPMPSSCPSSVALSAAFRQANSLVVKSTILLMFRHSHLLSVHRNVEFAVTTCARSTIVLPHLNNQYF